MDIVEAYLAKMGEIRGSGNATGETSYYPAIEPLLAEIGKALKPRVKPVSQLRNRGAGQPDIGLFTQDQQRKTTPSAGRDFISQPPNRGVVEIKAPAESLDQTIQSGQVLKYLQEYKHVLLTNYREFRIVERDLLGQPRTLETFTLASTESAFWQLVAEPRKAAAAQGRMLAEFLTRAMLYPVPVTSPQYLAAFLASYARDALAKVEASAELPELAQVRKALEEALGLQFTGEKGEHFFRSTLVQTLFYGLFSAWVLWCRQPGRKDADRFPWREAVWSLQVPMIRALYERVANPGHLEPLGLVHLLNLTGDVLNRVDRDAFFQSFEEGTAVQYFYEPFLQAFDPVLRKELGVWYTPREIVRYMVERVDQVLRSELGVADGLADPNVYVLDPACGTGAYLVEVLERIQRTLTEQRGEDALIPQDVKRAAMDRVFGFEILPAPFVIAHLQLGLLLQKSNAPLLEKGKGQDKGKPKGRERVAVYLTNALTGWEPPDKTKARLPFEEFEQEREEADQIKRDKPILVILGNPPYNAFAGVSPTEEDGLVEPYKKGLISEWGIKKFNLDDLYVRFFRLAERRIAEKTGKGVVCYISNYSYLSGPSYVVMRERLRQNFDALWFDSLNGDKYATGKITPDGKPDPSVFSTDANTEGIQVGTAIGLMVRKAKRKPGPVRYRDLWGTRKREDLLDSLADAKKLEAQYQIAEPTKQNRYSFRPETVAAHYREWPRIVELCAEPPNNGLMEKRGGALIDMDKSALESRMRTYFDSKLNWEEYLLQSKTLSEPQAGFDPEGAREKVLRAEGFLENRTVRYAVRPFDTRWCYYSGIPPLWNRARPSLWPHVFLGNAFLAVRPKAVADPEGFPLLFATVLGDNDAMRGHAYYIPLLLPAEEQEDDGHHGRIKAREDVPTALPSANLSADTRSYLKRIGAADPDGAAMPAASLIWMHSLAVTYAMKYLGDNADGVQQDWPRIPLPNTLALLQSSAELGRQVAALLDTESGVAGVTSGTVRTELRMLGRLERIGGKALNVQEDLQITAGWAYAGKDGVTMPGRGHAIEREYTKDERESLLTGAKALGISETETLQRLGETTFDIYLNDDAAWKNVPARVWEFYIGGYQVMKKWLSYREFQILGRAVTPDEAREVTAMARRLAALCLLQPALDENYRRVKESAFPWGTLGKPTD